MVNGINSYNSYMNYLQPQAARGRPDPAEMFNKVDTDGSGGISQSELDTFIQDLTSKNGSSIDTDNTISTYDTDGSGELSQDELKSFMEATMPRHGGMMRMGGDRGHEDPFNALDTDGSGGISQSELDTFVQDITSKTDSSIDTDNAVSTYDTDGNGELSTDELKSFMDANNIAPPPPPPGGPGMMHGMGQSNESSDTTADGIISAYDTNGDGVLSSDELQAYMDDTGSSSSFSSLIQQAISAYDANSYENLFNMESTLLDFSNFDSYSPVDLAV